MGKGRLNSALFIWIPGTDHTFPAVDDPVIPPEFGKWLYGDYQGSKQLWIQDGCGHNSLDYRTSAPWWSEATAFLLAHAPPKGN